MAKRSKVTFKVRESQRNVDRKEFWDIGQYRAISRNIAHQQSAAGAAGHAAGSLARRRRPGAAGDVLLAAGAAGGLLAAGAEKIELASRNIA